MVQNDNAAGFFTAGKKQFFATYATNAALEIKQPQILGLP